MSVQQVCVVYVLRSTPTGSIEVLLGRKLTGIGAGKVVAPGGKLESFESPHDAAVRELREEVGERVSAGPLRTAGVNRYRFPTRPGWDQDSHVFVADWIRGEPVASPELIPFWVLTAEIPYARMWSDAVFWLPAVLAGQPCGGEYVFASDLTTVRSSRQD